jgi:hypothetical protein
MRDAVEAGNQPPNLQRIEARTTFGTMNADVLAEKLPGYTRPNFCAIIRGSKHST